MFFNDFRQFFKEMLGEIHKIHKGITHIMSSQADLDAALVAVSNKIETLTGAINSIIAKNNQAPTPLDLSNEIATLNGLGVKLDTETAAIDAAITPPASTEPTPPAA